MILKGRVGFGLTKIAGSNDDGDDKNDAASRPDGDVEDCRPGNEIYRLDINAISYNIIKVHPCNRIDI